MPALEMNDIKKRFGGTIALDGVSLQVAPGEIPPASSAKTAPANPPS